MVLSDVSYILILLFIKMITGGVFSVLLHYCSLQLFSNIVDCSVGRIQTSKHGIHSNNAFYCAISIASIRVAHATGKVYWLCRVVSLVVPQNIRANEEHWVVSLVLALIHLQTNNAGSVTSSPELCIWFTVWLTGRCEIYFNNSLKALMRNLV